MTDLALTWPSAVAVVGSVGVVVGTAVRVWLGNRDVITAKNVHDETDKLSERVGALEVGVGKLDVAIRHGVQPHLDRLQSDVKAINGKLDQLLINGRGQS